MQRGCRSCLLSPTPSSGDSFTLLELSLCAAALGSEDSVSEAYRGLAMQGWLCWSPDSLARVHRGHGASCSTVGQSKHRNTGTRPAPTSSAFWKAVRSRSWAPLALMAQGTSHWPRGAAAAPQRPSTTGPLLLPVIWPILSVSSCGTGDTKLTFLPLFFFPAT